MLAFFLVTPGGASLDIGTGDDTFVIEQGIAIEGISASGDAAEYQELVEAPPPVLQTVPAVEEVKPVEEDVQHVIGSDTGPEQEKIAREPEPEEVKEPPKPEQIATRAADRDRTRRGESLRPEAGGRRCHGDVRLSRQTVHAHLPEKDQSAVARCRLGRCALHRRSQWRADVARNRDELGLENSR